jgi:hypothetical protein
MAMKPCRECTKEVSTEAKTCPHCGVSFPTRKKTSKLAIAVLVVVGVIVVAAVAGSGDKGAGSGGDVTDEAPAPAVTVAAVDLWKAYDANEVAADEVYKDKRLLVTGAVASIDKDIMDDVVLMLSTPNEFMKVHAQLEDSEASAAAALKKGASVTVACTGGGLIMGSPILKDCRIQ